MGVFYALTFKDDIEPEGFLGSLSEEIKAAPMTRQSTRVGRFERMIVFRWHYNRVDGDKVQPVRRYMFFVEGFMRSITWITEILGRYGAVSFPVGEDEWTFPFGKEIPSEEVIQVEADDTSDRG